MKKTSKTWILTVSLSALILLFSVSACEKVFEEHLEITINTDKSLYEYSDSLFVTIYNPLSEAIYYRRCGINSFRYSMKRLDEDGVETIVVPDNCRSFNQTLMMVPPRDSVQLGLTLQFITPHDQQPEGIYRLDVLLLNIFSLEADTTFNNRSNPFTVSGATSGRYIDLDF